MPGEAPDENGDGPPSEYVEGDLDADFFQTPYGLFGAGRAGAPRRPFGQGIEPLRLRVEAGRRGRARARRGPVRSLLLDREPPRRGPRRARDQDVSPRRARGGRRPARHSARARDARPPSRDRHRRRRGERNHLPRAHRPPRDQRRGDRRRGDGVPGRRRDRDGSGAGRGRRPRPHRLAARLLRHAHRHDLARLPMALHLLRGGGELGTRLPRPVGRITCSTRWRRPSRALP